MGFVSIKHFSLSLAFLLILINSVPFLCDAITKISAFFVLIKISGWLMTTTRKYVMNPKLSSNKKAVFITGCDSGIGYLLARRLDQLEYVVFAGCMVPGGDGARALVTASSSRLKIVPLDVTSDESVQNAVKFVKELLADNELWAIVNNAGIGQAGEIDWTSLEHIHRPYEVNAIGTVRITKAFLPLIQKSKGRVVNNTSICARLTCPGYAGYCMSKSAARAFTTALRIEMVKWSVKVINVEAFFYRTPIAGYDLNLKLIEDTWNNAPEDIRKKYGEKYLNAFKNSCTKLLDKSSTHINDVIYCFEDAITSQEPLTSYFPAYFPHKVGISLFLNFPAVVAETFQRYQMPVITPDALIKDKVHTNGTIKVKNNMEKQEKQT